MELFSAPNDCACHCARIVLAEKGLEVKIREVDPQRPPEDLLDLNPQQSLPTLVDRDLVLYDYRVVIEYLDERFPHPPLLPPDPINRARARLALYRIHDDWYSLLPAIEKGKPAESERARKLLREGLMASAAAFAAKPFFLSDEFSLLDCMLTPLLWRLPHYGIKFTRSAKSTKLIQGYTDRLFSRLAFRRSMNPVERELRPNK